MAFKNRCFQLISAPSRKLLQQIYAYLDVTDTLATIMTIGYFNDFINEIRVNDLMIIRGTSEEIIVKVTSVTTNVTIIELPGRWMGSIISKLDFTTSEPAAPTVGDRYINTVTGNSNVTTQAVTKDYIYEWNGVDWTEFVPRSGSHVYDESTKMIYFYTGSEWIDPETYWDRVGTDLIPSTATDSVAILKIKALTAAGLALRNDDDSAGALINDDGELEIEVIKANDADGVSILNAAETEGVKVNDDGYLEARKILANSVSGLDLTNDAGELGLRVTDGGDVVVGQGVAGKDYTLTIDGETNDGIVTWKEDEAEFNFDSTIEIGNGSAGVDYELKFNGETNDGAITWDEDNAKFIFDHNLVVGVGAAGVDYTIRFDGDDNDGTITWLEDESQFHFDHDIDVQGSVTAYDILPFGTIRNLILSNNAVDAAHDIDIAEGSAKDVGAVTDMHSTGVFTKRLDATWVVGTGNGGLGAGAIAINTQYHVFMIMSSARNVDFGFDTVGNAANLLATSGYIYYRYIGTVYTDATPAILAFKQVARTFIFSAPILSPIPTNPGTAAFLITVAVPTIVKTQACFNIGGGQSAGLINHVYFSDPDSADLAPSIGGPPGCQLRVPNTIAISSTTVTTSGGQIRIRCSASDPSTGLLLVLTSYTDFEY